MVPDLDIFALRRDFLHAFAYALIILFSEYDYVAGKVPEDKGDPSRSPLQTSTA